MMISHREQLNITVPLQAETSSRSYTSSKYQPKHMKNDSFSCTVLLQSPYALSLLLQTAVF